MKDQGTLSNYPPPNQYRPQNIKNKIAQKMIKLCDFQGSTKSLNKSYWVKIWILKMTSILVNLYPAYK